MNKSEKEVFKISKKSICNNYKNVELKCYDKVSISCGTDSKIGMAYVDKCSFFNKDFIKLEYKENIVMVNNIADTRLEMMGGGH